MAELINITVSIITIVLSMLGGYLLATIREAIRLKYKKNISTWVDLAKFGLTEGRDAFIELIPVFRSLFKKDIDDIKAILEYTKPIPVPASKDAAELLLIQTQNQLFKEDLNKLQEKLNKSAEFIKARGHEAEYEQHMKKD